ETRRDDARVVAPPNERPRRAEKDETNRGRDITIGQERGCQRDGPRHDRRRDENLHERPRAARHRRRRLSLLLLLFSPPPPAPPRTTLAIPAAVASLFYFSSSTPPAVTDTQSAPLPLRTCLAPHPSLATRAPPRCRRCPPRGTGAGDPSVRLHARARERSSGR